MQYGGESLATMCLCDPERNQRIHDAVQEQLTKALKHFHRKRLSFVGIHPGNILVQETGHDNQIAVLFTDIESIRPHKRGKQKNWRRTEPAARFKDCIASEEWHTPENDFRSLSNVLKWISSQKVGGQLQ